MSDIGTNAGLTPRRAYIKHSFVRKRMNIYFLAICILFAATILLCANYYVIYQSYIELQQNFKQASDETKQIIQDRNELLSINKNLSGENKKIKLDIDRITQINSEVSQQVNDIKNQNNTLKTKNKELSTRNQELAGDNIALQNSLKMAAAVGIKPQNYISFNSFSPQSNINRGKYIGMFKGTAYTPSVEECGNNKGITNSGKPIIPGITIAVDNKYWPFGTVFYIKGLGYTVAMDTGSAIKGKYRFDFAVFDKKFANLLGVRKWDVYLVKLGNGNMDKILKSINNNPVVNLFWE